MATRKPKTTTKPAKAAKATKPAKATKATKAVPAAGPVVTIIGQPAKPYRPTSARGLYWQAVQAHQGKPLATLLAHLGDPATCPHPKVQAGAAKPENPATWFNWFCKQGVCGTK